MAEYEIPEDLAYSKEDEWVRTTENRLTVGVTDFAQQQLGDIVFVELPELGLELNVGDTFGVIESVKAVSDLFSPVAGTIVEVNALLKERPEAVNEDCYCDGWMVVIAGKNEESNLLSAEDYRKHIESRDD